MRLHRIVAPSIIALWIAVQPLLAESGPSVTTTDEASRRGKEAFDREDYPSAVEWWRKSAELGDAKSAVLLGDMYRKGWGVSANYAEAMKWYRKSADQGFALGQGMMCFMYNEGLGVSKDPAVSALWCRKAAEQGEPIQQVLMGYMYMLGKGVPTDYARSMAWFRKAADQGLGDGYIGIGTLYRDGLGFPKDYAKAEAAYRKAASLGSESAKEKLAYLHKLQEAAVGAKYRKIPPIIMTMCLLEAIPDQHRSDAKSQQCLRSQWKQRMGSQPFPLD